MKNLVVVAIAAALAAPAFASQSVPAKPQPTRPVGGGPIVKPFPGIQTGPYDLRTGGGSVVMFGGQATSPTEVQAPPPPPVVLLLPAVQKVREAAARAR